jgi:hypothetical protein
MDLIVTSKQIVEIAGLCYRALDIRARELLETQRASSFGSYPIHQSRRVWKKLRPIETS